MILESNWSQANVRKAVKDMHCFQKNIKNVERLLALIRSCVAPYFNVSLHYEDLQHRTANIKLG